MASAVITITDAVGERLMVSVKLIRLPDDPPLTAAVAAMHAITDGLVDTGLAAVYHFDSDWNA